MSTAVALCALGAERALSNELRKLGMTVYESTYGKVRFGADLAGLYRSLMALRTADRVLLEAASFPSVDFDQLFEGVRSVPWEDLVPRPMRVVVGKVRVSRSKLQAATSIQAVVHKAAAERLCASWGMARLRDLGGAAELRVYLEKDRAQILLDLSGEPLFKRGYRSESGAAPLRETTAAALVLLSAWRRKYPLYDPFCGSGTIAVEAALYAWDAAPGVGRRFALQDLAIADGVVEQTVRRELAERVDFTRLVRIHGSDSDPRSVSIAESNARRAYELARGQIPGRGIRLEKGGATLPSFQVLDMRKAVAPWAEEGYLVTNPPYGGRLGDQTEAEGIYSAMGGLPSRFPGWRLAVITNHPGFESHFGHAADSVKELTNGALRSYLYQYESLGGKADVHRR